MTRNPVQIGVIDDHPLVARGVSAEPPEMYPVSVRWQAATVEEALEHLLVHIPPVVLCDVRLGDAFAHGFWRRCAGQTAVIVYSAFYLQEDVLAAHQAGVRAYLTKDTPLQEVRRAIHEVAAGHRILSDSDRRLLRAGNKTAISPREREVLHLLFHGLSYVEIAGQLAISLQSVKTYQQNIFRKLGVGSRGEAVYQALARGLIVGPQETVEPG